MADDETGHVGMHLPCPSGKQRHVDKAAARRQLQSLRSNVKKERSRTTAYRCGLCGYWHVGRR